MKKFDLKSEYKTFFDGKTGRRIQQWTDSNKKDQHLYFTTPCITEDATRMVILSERDGSPNLYCLEREELVLRKVSNATGLLRSYTYPEGGDTGLSKASPVLDPFRQIVYWIQDDAVWMSDLKVDFYEPERLASLPKGWVTAYTHLSRDGTKLCLTCTDPGAFNSEDRSQHHQLRAVPQRMLGKSLHTIIFVLDTTNGEVLRQVELPFWVTHVQFNPMDGNQILCNSEGVLASLAKRNFTHWGRIWLVDANGRYYRLFEQDEGRFVNHENWCRNGDAIVCHGKEPLSGAKFAFRKLLAVLLRAGILNKKNIDKLYHHFVEAYCCDGKRLWVKHMNFPVSHAISTCNEFKFLCDSADGYIYLFDSNSGETEALCRHNSSMSEQDAHPHPTRTTNNAGVIFTSDSSGSCNVFEASL